MKNKTVKQVQKNHKFTEDNVKQRKWYLLVYFKFKKHSK